MILELRSLWEAVEIIAPIGSVQFYLRARIDHDRYPGTIGNVLRNEMVGDVLGTLETITSPIEAP